VVDRERDRLAGDAHRRWLYLHANRPGDRGRLHQGFTAPLVDLYMLAVLLADLRGVLSKPKRRVLVNDLRLVPDLVGRCLDREARWKRLPGA
jgi:hypothetical protein